MSNFRKKPEMKKRCKIYSSDEDIPDQTDNFLFTDSEEMSSSSNSIISDETDDDFWFEDNYSNVNNDNIPQNNSDWLEEDIDPVLHDFTEQDGLKIKLSTDTSSFDIFSLLFDNSLIEKIIHWTNSHAEVLINTTYVSNNSNLKKWTPVTVDEIKKFLGLCIVMGNIRMPSLKSYWSTNMLYNHPLFGKTMCRNRFESILRCLRFYDETDNQTNRFHKIDQVLNHVLKNIRNIYYPGEDLSINEALVLWKGRLLFKQSIPVNGIKINELCTPDGFVLNIIYGGKNADNNTSDVVYKLLQNYLGKGHTIFMNNYYNSVKLATSLYKDKTHVVGILHKNRKDTPIIVTNKKLKKGESIFARKGNILVQKWKDRRDILVISTKHKASFEEVLSKKGGTKMKPSALADYNKNMSATDRVDQMISYYSTPRKSIRWYLNIFFHLFDVAIWNSCCLYNKIHSTKMSYLEFRDDLACKLLNSGCETTMISVRNNLYTQHFIQKLEKRIRCHVCANNKRRKATFYACEVCKTKNGQPIGLCVDKCFKIYHTFTMLNT